MAAATFARMAATWAAASEAGIGKSSQYGRIWIVTKSTALLHVGIAQPVFPDVGVGDRLCHLRLDLADGGHEVRRRHLPAQQHLVADNDGADDVGIFLGERDRGRDLPAVLVRTCWRAIRRAAPSARAAARWQGRSRRRHRSNRCGCSWCISTAAPGLLRSARARPGSPRPGDPARRGTAHRRRSRAFRPAASGDGGSAIRRAEPPPHSADRERRERERRKRRTDCLLRLARTTRTSH